MATPFRLKSATEIKDIMLEHLVNGTPTIDDEKHINNVSNPTYVDDIPPLTYKLQSGLPDITDGKLVSIERIHGKFNNSFKEFSIIDDYTFDVNANILSFVSGKEPDVDTDFFVSYKYDQGYKSPITASGRGTVTDMIFSPVALRVADLFRNAELVKLGGFIGSAVGDDLRELLKIVNITAKTSSKANGFVTVYRNTGSGDTIIPTGAQFSSNATELNPAVLFENIVTGLFYDGFTSARLPVVAKTGYEGKSGNIAPRKLINVDISVASISQVVNPPNYQDYEFQDIITGKYVYNLNYLPERVINSGNAYPPSSVDNGLYGIMYWLDEDIDTTTNWTKTDPNSELTITEDDPEAGTIKVVVSAITGNPYIEIDTLDVPREDDTLALQGYDQVFLYARGSIGGETFKIQVEDNWGTPNVGDPLLYKFDDVFPQTPLNTGTLSTEFSLFHGLHDLATFAPETANIKKVRIYFLSAGTFFFDWIGLGTFITEQSTFTTVDQIKISYTSGKVTLNSAGGQDVFDTYDGDGSDGHVDQLMVFYKWKNNFSGGAEEETDDELRERGITTVSGLGKGTKQAIRKALLDIDAVKQVEVLDYDDDQTILPGDIDVVLFAEGFTVSPALQQEIIQSINDNKAAGIRPNIFLPEIRYVNFTVNFVFDDRDDRYASTSGQTVLISLIKSVIAEYYDEKVEVNQNLYWSNLIGYVIQSIDVVVSGTVTEDLSTTPAYSDDDFSGTYAYSSSVVKAGYILASKSGVSIVVQQGNNISVLLTKLTSQ